jgi:hypothetical protein
VLGNSTLRTMQGVACRDLPLRPGDYLVFQASGARMLVIASTEQLAREGHAGQRIAGLMSGMRGSRWEDFWIDWIGYNTVWNIHRS